MLLPLLLASTPVQAHPAAASAVLLDIGRDSVHVELQIPRDQLDLALEASGFPEPADYLDQHLALIRPDGTALIHDPLTLDQGLVDGQSHLLAATTFRTPDGSPVGPFQVHDDAVLHQVVSHRTYVTVRRDPWSPDAQEGRLAGVIRYLRPSVDVDREPVSRFGLFADAVQLGAEHLLGGWDHLLFLFTLLIASAREGRGETRAVLTRVGTVISLFTVGHGLTLALAALGIVHPPVFWTELVVLASVAIAAVHAIRPLWPRAELPMALVFGLAHGLAFAETLSLVGVDVEGVVWTLLGFDAGIELVQLGLAALVVPLLLAVRPPARVLTPVPTSVPGGT